MQMGILIVAAMGVASTTLGNTLYVSPSGTHQPPYATWGAAATNIQDAIDVATDGDTVLVTNGTYATGGMVVHGSMTNRIAVTNAITVRSVNGPELTFIVGSGPLGDAAVRCAYVGDGARLAGFTLTNGHTRTAGDTRNEQSGGGAWCEPSAVVSNCSVSGNVVGRQRGSGGGTYGGTVQNCNIWGNSAGGGGGTAEGTTSECVITGNSAVFGGGAMNSVVQNSTVSSNTASSGAGTAFGTVQNSSIFGNLAGNSGGGTYQSTVQNCSIFGNSARLGGGTYYSEVLNCIVYYNSADGAANCYGNGVEYTCTTPDPGGTGNVTNAPGLVGLGDPHIMWNSPCVDAGSNQSWMATAADIDREPRIGNGTVDMGCDEIHAGGLTGALAVAILSDYTYALVDSPIRFDADMEGRPAGYQWVWEDGGVTPNTLQVTRTYAMPGDYDVTLQAWNLDGVASATRTVHIVTGYTNYVSLSGSHTTPYMTWATAATNIQAAISANIPGGLVLVTNGVYDRGGTVVHDSMTNRVAITKAVTVRSVNGPESTFIVGSGPLGDTAVRCVYVGDDARLEGFTLTNGHTRTSGDRSTERSGGGAWCATSAVVSNCTISGNSASVTAGGIYEGTIQRCTISENSAGGSGGGIDGGTSLNSIVSGNSAGGHGGGILGGTSQNCTIFGNSAGVHGGGTFAGTFQNCTVSGNVADEKGGGTYLGTIRNSIVYDNSAGPGFEANCEGGTVEYTCTTPDPGGPGNITGAPLFVNAALSNYHLQPASPCIDAGDNQPWMLGASDLDGIPRVQNGVVDLGAYEIEVPGSDVDGDGVDDDWELAHFLGLTNISFHTDWDLDGYRDGFEFHAGTSPTNASSYLGITSLRLNQAGTEAVIRWSSVSNKHYSVYCTSNLIDGLEVILDEHLPATPSENVYTDTVEGAEWRSYGVQVEQ